ncbi:hypothetical protein AB6D11_03080 [Vibrio splendidus]
MVDSARRLDIMEPNLVDGSRFTKLVQAIGHVEWDMGVELILRATGLSSSLFLSQQEPPISPTSEAKKLGHSTLRSFITAPESKFGLNMDWDEWISNVQALELRETYCIPQDKPEDILQEYQDVCRVLGDKPLSAIVYNSVKMQIYNQQISKIGEKYNSEISEKDQLLKAEESRSSVLNETNLNLRDRIRQVGSFLEIESNLNDTDNIETLLLNNPYHTKKIDSLLEEIESQKKAHVEAQSELVSKYNDEQFAPRSELTNAKERLNEYIEKALELENEVKEGKVALELSMNETASLRQSNEDFSALITSQTQRINQLNIEIVRIQSSPSTPELQSELSATQEELATELSKYKAALNSRVLQVGKQQKQIKDLKVSLTKHKSFITSLQNKLKWEKINNISLLIVGIMILSGAMYFA